MIRNATSADLPSLMAIEELSWKPHLRASVDTIRHRLSSYPEGQFIVEVDGVVKGVLYTQRIRDVDEMTGRGFEGQASLHDPAGEIIQLLAINVPAGLFV